MDEKTKKRLIHIRDATKVNKQHLAEQERRQTERYERSREQVKIEIYDNRNINYRKHIRW